MLFALVLRACGAVFSPNNDAAFRTLGLLIGLGVCAALWTTARRLGCRWPWCSLALLGCNPLFVRYTDSVRAYGLGILLMLLTFGAVWQAVERLSWRRALIAAGLGVLSVQTLYYNSVLLLAACAGGAVAAGCARQGRKARGVLLIGAPAAASLIAYRATFREVNEWSFLVHYPAPPAWLWKKLSDVTRLPEPVGVWVWTLLALGAVAWVGWRLWNGRREAGADGVGQCPQAAVYAGASLVVGTVGYGLFLLKLQYFTQPWYYIAYLALAAVCLDAILNGGPEVGSGRRLAGLTGALAFAALAYFPARQELRVRQTNADLAAARVGREAAAGDLVAHLQWERATPFARYYHGAAEQVTLPPIADHRFHRYDQVLAQMATPDAAGPVLARMGEALRAGHKVWVVGNLAFLPPGRRPRQLAPARKEAGRWRLDGDYYDGWAAQAAYFLQTHATAGGPVSLRTRQPVNEYENFKLGVLSGWQEAPASAP